MLRKHSLLTDENVVRAELAAYLMATEIESRIGKLARRISVFPEATSVSWEYAEKWKELFQDCFNGAHFRGGPYRAVDEAVIFVKATQVAYRMQAVLRVEPEDKVCSVAKPLKLTIGFYKKAEREPFEDLELTFDESGQICRAGGSLANTRTPDFW
jgi:hypothetical protein